MAEDTQAKLDALAAAVTPTGTTAGPKTNQATQAAPKASVDPFAAEMAQFQLEQARKQAEFENKKRELELQDLELSIRARKAQLKQFEKNEFDDQRKEEDAKMNAATKGTALAQQAESQKKTERRCNHKKGGNGLQGIIGGRGDSGQYAILKHQMSNGDWWVRCLRCGKTWKPPLERSFKNPADFIKADAEYQIALEFQTLNSPSSSALFTFSDQGQFYREQMEHVTLR